MREQFIEKNFRHDTLVMIDMANEIIADYRAQGFSLTLRQLYYQFVARDLIPNTERSYKRLGSIINDARLAGLIDWQSIEDRTRNLRRNSHWDTPADVIRSALASYGIDMWENQPNRVEVWIEKEALSGVISGVCRELDVPHFACRGYVSQSEQWRAGVRHRGNDAAGQDTIVLHLGDHDPSGIDMTRDNDDRLTMFGYGSTRVKRIALNMDQIDEYAPPPNPAKVTDSRFDQYLRDHGAESWELDALEPSVIVDLIRTEVAALRDDDLWAEKEAQLNDDLGTLNEIVTNLEA